MARNVLITFLREAERQSRRNAQARARSNAQANRDHARSLREEARAMREQDRDEKREAKERQKQYTENRIAETEDKNAELIEVNEVLETLLVDSFSNDPAINFSDLLVQPEVIKLSLGDLAKPIDPPLEIAIPKPSVLVSWIPSIKKSYQQKLSESAKHHTEAIAGYHLKEAARKEGLRKLEEKHARREQEAKVIADDTNRQLEQWKKQFYEGDSEAVVEYFQMVLEKSDYPDGFSQNAKVLYVKDSKQLVVEYNLPRMDDIIPTVKAYKYVKSSDTITETLRVENQRRALYSNVIAQITLRCLWEIFQSDTQEIIDTIVLSGYVETINPSTGKEIRPCLVTVRVTRDKFEDLQLQQVEPIACLRELKASFSKSPGELAPVRPILELNMIDPRFVQESDVLSTLDQRSNLMDLTPSNFESLITNLFQKMGLDTKMTQASRDGGVDCVAFDPRPIFGGKVVIQAKRYKNTVGVSAVRDLFGTMQNEGASKGILVTTSGYGKAAFDFANGKPLELLDGGNLLYLLKEHSGIDAKIVMPDEWQDIGLDNGL